MRIKNKDIEQFSIWLTDKFNQYSLVSELHLIGSIIGGTEINDVDVVQLLNFQTVSVLKEYSIVLKKIRILFYEEFYIPLHITSFTHRELNNFNTFMSLNDSKRLI